MEIRFKKLKSHRRSYHKFTKSVLGGNDQHESLFNGLNSHSRIAALYKMSHSISRAKSMPPQMAAKYLEAATNIKN